VPLSRDVPQARVRARVDRPASARGRYVLYWMIAHRRAGWNFSLQRAAEWARRLDRPLVVLEALRAGYPWASDRLHAFVMQGMRDNRAAFARHPVLYYPYLEPRPGAGRGLLEALARDACVVVTDDFPCFFLPRMVAAAARRLDCRLEEVDANGLLPMREAGREFLTAHSFRRFLQRALPAHLRDMPRADPLRGLRLPLPAPLPGAVTRRWPHAGPLLDDIPAALSKMPIDHGVPPAPAAGGAAAAARALRRFVRARLERYGEQRSLPGIDGTSRLSPWLHFGHIGAHQVFSAVARAEGWSPDRLRPGRATGSRDGWWGMSRSAEGFLDELITWRELAYNLCAWRDDHERYDTVPAWARRTLAEHAADPRPRTYTLRQLEEAATHDAVWNAAQTQLLREGWFHNQMRMLWGKKILEWSPTPRAALRAMAELMGRWSLDGRNPNSWSGYFWVLGRADRPWGPERPIFGTVRYMSSDSTARKGKLKDYLAVYAPDPSRTTGRA
jgi:deoxyribodipyrimidine photo-lyase